MKLTSHIYLLGLMRLRNRLFNLRVRVLLPIVTAAFWGGAEANAFDRLYPDCSIASTGSAFQKSIIRVVKDCINEDEQTSFYNMRLLEKRNLRAIFGELDPKIYKLIIILNGIDQVSLREEVRIDSELYKYHINVIGDNKKMLGQLLNQVGIGKLTEDCMELISIKGCYSQAKEKITLPDLTKIKLRIYFLLH